MAITAYTGVPGSGKSYALVSQVILPALENGRTVRSNVAGLDLEAFDERLADNPNRGRLVLFDGRDALGPDFFPTETEPHGKFVEAGDLVVFDEFKLYFPKRGPMPNPDLEPFLRWHRHLVADDGTATDVAIAAQLIMDIHPDIRGLIERNYKFRKLSAIGLNTSYAYTGFEGHEQDKSNEYTKGNGRYKKDIFALYKSYDTAGQAKEQATDSRANAFSGKIKFAIAGVCAILLGGAYGVYSFFNKTTAPVSSQEVPQPQAANQSAPAQESPLRIVGYITGTGEPQVILTDDNGVTRLVPATLFTFANGRPVSGIVDGKRVVAKDRVILPQQGNFDESF